MPFSGVACDQSFQFSTIGVDNAASRSCAGTISSMASTACRWYNRSVEPEIWRLAVMDIALSEQTHRLLQEKLNKGVYRSADEVVRAALEALDELEAHGLDAQTLDAIDQAEAQIERGEVHAWENVREQVRSRFFGK
jgi:putative addiction module CopG family antidote